jgi:hypothetical protein
LSGSLPASLVLATTGDGGWSWFGDPRAVHYNNKTYFGTIGSDGDVLVGSVDHSTDTISSLTTLRAAMEQDDHDNPSLLVRDSDKKILAWYCRHGNGLNTQMYQRVSSNAEDVASFAAETDLDSQIGGNLYTYPNPVQLLSETNDPIYLFFRNVPSGTTENFCFTKSTDGGATWSAMTTLFSPGTNIRSYRKVGSDGQGRIDFALTDAHPADGACSLYHFYYEGGNYYRTDGTQITASLPLAKTDLTLVYDGTTERSWVWDVATNGGNPVITFATFPTTSAHRYRYARWNGSTWVLTTVVDNAGAGFSPSGSGEEYYSAGIVVDHSDPNVVYLSVAEDSGYNIYRYTTANQGSSFTGEQLTTRAAEKHVRPFVPKDRNSEMPVLWSTGTYTSYTSWSMATRGARGF